MIKRVYAVRDCKMNQFQSPFLESNDAGVIRSFGDLVTSKEKTLYTMHPEDFTLCCLGEFNLETGVFIPLAGGVLNLAQGTDFSKE